MDNCIKYLPLGSVVLLKNAKKKLVIVGYKVKSYDGFKVYDYLGYLYPEGYISSNHNFMFNHEQISMIVSKGYINEKYYIYNDKLNKE